MNSKKFKYLLWILCAMPLMITAIFVRILPDLVPIHYNIAGEIDSWGSKYKNFYVATVFVFIGVIFQFMAWRISKKLKKKSDSMTAKETIYANTHEKALLSMGCIVMTMLVMIDIVSLIKQYYTVSENTNNINLDTNRILSFIYGVAFVLIGNVLPKLKNNRLFGIRTVWSMDNNRSWILSQKYGGIALVACGFSVIISSCILPTKWLIIYMTVSLIITSIISIYLTYVAYKKTKE